MKNISIIIEHKLSDSWFHKKEVPTTFELAQITGQSPARMNRLVKESPMRMWHYIPGTKYRIWIRDLSN